MFAALAVLGGALLTGCDAPEPGPTAPATPATTAPSTSAPATPSSSPAPTDGEQLLLDARDALYLSGKPFHVAGNLTELDKTFDLSFGADHRSCTGTVTDASGVTVEIMRTADEQRYVRAPAAYYAHLRDDGDPDDPDLSPLAGRWVAVDVDSGSLFLTADVTSLDLLVFAVGPDPDVHTYEISGPTTIAGTSSYVVTDPRGDTFQVAAGNEPLPLVYTHDRRTGQAVFDRYGTTVSVVAPADAVPFPG